MEIVKFEPSQNGTQHNNALTVASRNAALPVSDRKPFIEANTLEVTLPTMRDNHIIPVFSKDNETLISHVDFIEVVQEVAASRFSSERICEPSICVSHPIKGRTPEARYKPVNELQEHERTLYYERCAFIIEIPSISDNIGGESLCLTIGGVKAYNMDNLNSKKGSLEHFKLFIGFRVKVCTNLCISSDGYVASIKVNSLEQLKLEVNHLIRSYDAISDLCRLDSLQQYSLNEAQFAHLLGKCKMYQYLPTAGKEALYGNAFGDSFLNTVCKEYYKSESFCRQPNGDISLWRLLQLFTEANKGSYIDSFLDRGVASSSFVGDLAYAQKRNTYNWFLA